MKKILVLLLAMLSLSLVACGSEETTIVENDTVVNSDEIIDSDRTTLEVNGSEGELEAQNDGFKVKVKAKAVE